MPQKEYQTARDADFKQAVGRVIRERNKNGEQIRMSEAVRAAINGGAPHYYISYDYAYRHLSLYRRGKKNRKGARPEMWVELDRRVNELGKRRPDAPVSRRLEEVLRSGATRFFITERYGMRLINRVNGRSPLG